MVSLHRAIAFVLLLAGAAGQLGCATTAAKKDEELTRKRASTHFDIAVDHVQKGQIELALRDLLTAERLDPKDARTQHALGMAYLQKGKIAEAEQHLLRALELSPGYHDARFNLSTLYLNQGRLEECIQQSGILFDDPTFTAPWRALTNRGWARYKLGRAREARADLERSRAFNPSYWPTLLDLGILEADQGRKPEAIRLFNEVLTLDPGPSATAEASYRLAEIYVSLGHREEAVNHLRTAVVRAPSDPWGKKSEEYLKLLR